MEEFLLKEHPQLKITVFSDRFEIHRPEKRVDQYHFNKIDFLSMGKRANWLVSAFSFIVGFFIGDAGDIYKERDLLKFTYRNQQIARSLKGCHHDTA